MTLKETIAPLKGSARGKALASALKSKSQIISVYNLAGSSAAVMLSLLPRMKQPVVVIGDSLDDAGYLYHDLSRLLGEEAVAMLPSGYKRHIKYGQPDPPSQILRTEALTRWSTDPALQFVVTYPEALAERVADRDTITRHTLTLDTSRPADLTETVEWLRSNGFVETDYVYEPGQFAVRGSILDIFGYSHELPFRIDFFGDDIDSMRTFNTETQLSEQHLESISITSNVASQSRGSSLLEFIDPSTLLAVRDASYTLTRIVEVTSETFSLSAAAASEGDAAAMKQLIDGEEFREKFGSFRRLNFTSAAAAETDATTSIDFRCTPQALYHKNFDLIAESFGKFLSQGYKLYILSDSDKQIERMRAIFADRGDNISFTPVNATLHEGFVDHQGKACYFTDHQIFDRFHKYNLKSDRARSGKLAMSLKELSSIEPGDYIVHVDHGVGRFAGLMRTNVSGRTQEMIKLTYANNDTIFVSIHSLHKLAKYRGKEGVAPKINKLGSGAWNRMKERTKSKLKDIARDLIKLYAARKNEKGFAFAPDSYMQHELEASFIYEDTPDQLTATKAVKTDMESDRPMDRLICGDVGFGKTEIAIRAAFKAAADNKQTAVLVPTTVLAYQHFRTFSERLKDFPVRVDYLSRARSAKETKAILSDLAEGKINILVGTHKLIGKTVKFKDLGLLVVDEEQKFGVAVKERLKQLKTNVDTLTMSATPIPRTLQFSLMGARDLSTITTPPANRYPIITTVTSLTDDMLAEAVNFEMSRNGQVFMVNNRIEGLNELEAMVRRLVPDARIIVAHGQMPPEKLEKAILDFTNHDYDILLSTTIIESGVDMPNVNTIIINNAQNFGLSELHQLRGRVGRSSRKAFCYLTVPPTTPLSSTARRRLQAIESFSELGSGIHIAMQDLDIRGAGNLLGAEQSGFIADLGYETYQKILKEAVTELRTEEFGDMTEELAKTNDDAEYVADCVIESDMELLLPADYVPQESERISLYQELDSIDREKDLLEFRERLVDRFGKIPHETAELLRIPRLRRLARRLGIEKVALKQDNMYVYFVDDNNVAYYQSPMFGKLLQYLQQNARRCRIREKNGRRSFAISQVSTVEEAVHILDQVLALPGL
ncbi:MAG: transcription-repair coupling factor [Firmicutes bacterium]|nr:transcription-repair coupling factor [Bacillota bacterium]MCM1400469.1 transcription-repair coupling factor [Bacteroides sp.]MCM1477440.1 transcription-repair coupling factor [Bacteroides sp.]